MSGQMSGQMSDRMHVAKLQIQPCKYKTGKTLGAGSYSVVKECVHIDTGKYYAAKVINKKLMAGREHMVHNEIAVLKKISMGHQNLLTLVDYFETTNNLYLITDLALGGGLFGRICRKVFYHESDAVDLIRTILSGICYMHDHGVVHRDLNPENILFRTPEDNADLLIADFGLSRIMDEEQFSVLTTTCGTPGYMAPEVFKKTGHGKPVDIWAIGVMTYFLLCGYTPFDRDSNLEEMQAILLGDYSFTPVEYWKDVSLGARDFIMRCLVFDPVGRITAGEALLHPFVSRSGLGKVAENDLLPAFKKNFNARRTLVAAVDTVRAINKLRAEQGKMVDARTLDPRSLDGQTVLDGDYGDSGYGTAISIEPVRSYLGKNKEAQNLGEAGISTIPKGWNPSTHSQSIPVSDAESQGERNNPMNFDSETPTRDRESNDIGSELSSDGEDLDRILSYCDAESTTDSSSDGGLEPAGMSSFAASHNNGLESNGEMSCESPDWSDLPASVEGNSHLERLLWPQKEHEDLLAVRAGVLNKSFVLSVFDQTPSLDRYIESNGLAWPLNNLQPVTSDHDVEKLSQRLESLRIFLGPDLYRICSKQLFKFSPLDGEKC